ncbi:MAG: Wzz/FepE/Etk N-terminal domain-containing protein [Gammaproteobacteria bacterium]
MNAQANDYEGEISLLEIWQILRDGWWLIAGATVLGALVAGLLALRAPDVYRAEAVVRMASSGGGAAPVVGSLLGQFGGLASLAGVDVSRLRGAAQSGEMILASRTFAEEFIVERGLLEELYPNAWDPVTSAWRPEVTDPPAIWQVAGSLKSAYKLQTLDDLPGAWSLTVEWQDPELAALWANQLVEYANLVARRRDIANAARTIEYLQARIAETNIVELQGVLYNLLETEQKTLMLANAREDYAFEVIDPAVVPLEPAKPDRRMMLLIGIGLGGVIGLGLAVALRIFRAVRDEARAQRPTA